MLHYFYFISKWIIHISFCFSIRNIRNNSLCFIFSSLQTFFILNKVVCHIMHINHSFLSVHVSQFLQSPIFSRSTTPPSLIFSLETEVLQETKNKQNKSRYSKKVQKPPFGVWIGQISRQKKSLKSRRKSQRYTHTLAPIVRKS